MLVVTDERASALGVIAADNEEALSKLTGAVNLAEDAKAKAADAQKRATDATTAAQQLTDIPGIGEKLAARILEYRQKNGAFKNVQELMNVKGVGEKSFGKLEPFVSAGDPKAPATR